MPPYQLKFWNHLPSELYGDHLIQQDSKTSSIIVRLSPPLSRYFPANENDVTKSTKNKMGVSIKVQTFRHLENNKSWIDATVKMFIKNSCIPHVHKLFNNVEQNIVIIKTLTYCMFLYLVTFYN